MRFFIFPPHIFSRAVFMLEPISEIPPAARRAHCARDKKRRQRRTLCGTPRRSDAVSECNGPYPKGFGRFSPIASLLLVTVAHRLPFPRRASRWWVLVCIAVFLFSHAFFYNAIAAENELTLTLTPPLFQLEMRSKNHPFYFHPHRNCHMIHSLTTSKKRPLRYEQ